MKSINQILRPYNKSDVLTDKILNWVHDYNISVCGKVQLTFRDPRQSPEHYVEILVKVLKDEGIEIINYDINPASLDKPVTNVTVDLIMSEEDALLYKLKYGE